MCVIHFMDSNFDGTLYQRMGSVCVFGWGVYVHVKNNPKVHY